MTAARLSPAASLLRNSKLFSLPPTLALPPQEASSETIARSDTATTPYPIRAAIETPRESLQKGDWGLKRALPLKTTTKTGKTGQTESKTGTPFNRVVGPLDTPEHTVDFESAADHVVTLWKWQHLQMPVQYPASVNTGYDDKTKHGVFNTDDDNTSNITNKPWTGVWPSIPPEDRTSRVPKPVQEECVEFVRAKAEQAELQGLELPAVQERPTYNVRAPKRWRYKGPWLAGMTGMEFDEFLKKTIKRRTHEFRVKVETQWMADKRAAARAKALEEGTSEQSEDISPEAAQNSTPGRASTTLTDPVKRAAEVSFQLAPLRSGSVSDGRAIRVGNLPENTREAQVRDFFSDFEFKFVSLEVEATGERVAYLDMKSAEEAQRAMSTLPGAPIAQMSESEYNTYLRALRRRPQIFGPFIAEFLDLADGPKPPTASLASRKEQWEYGRDTVAAPSYRNTGPPRTHPSAGLAYSRSRNYAYNDATYGPQNDKLPVVGRILKIIRNGNRTSATVGVAGFVTPRMDRKSSNLDDDFSNYRSKPGGQKLLVVPNAAMVNVEGLLDLHVRHAPDTHVLEGDEAVRQEARKAPDTSQYGTQIGRLDSDYKRADPIPEIVRRSRNKESQEDSLAGALDMIGKMRRE